MTGRKATYRPDVTVHVEEPYDPLWPGKGQNEDEVDWDTSGESAPSQPDNSIHWNPAPKDFVPISVESSPDQPSFPPLKKRKLGVEKETGTYTGYMADGEDLEETPEVPKNPSLRDTLLGIYGPDADADADSEAQAELELEIEKELNRALFGSDDEDDDEGDVLDGDGVGVDGRFRIQYEESDLE